MDFEAVYQRYFQIIYRFLLSLCRDGPLAEELAQETFLRAMENWQDFRGQCQPETWLISIAKNRYFDHCRRRKRIVLGEVPESSGNALDRALEDKEMLGFLHQALHRMPEPYKEVFTLRVFGELSYAQIGALFNKSETWGRVTYYRAKVKLQTELGKEYPHE